MKETTLVNDVALEGQNFVLLSFLSPERVETSEKSVLMSKISEEKDHTKRCELYEKLINLKTNLRGIKIRGVFSKEEDAGKYAEELRKNDPHFDIYMGSVGEWLPWDEDNKTEKYEYKDDRLNELMNGYLIQKKSSKLVDFKNH